MKRIQLRLPSLRSAPCYADFHIGNVRRQYCNRTGWRRGNYDVAFRSSRQTRGYVIGDVALLAYVCRLSRNLRRRLLPACASAQATLTPQLRNRVQLDLAAAPQRKPGVVTWTTEHDRGGRRR